MIVFSKGEKFDVTVDPEKQTLVMRGDLRACYGRVKELWRDHVTLICFEFPFESIQPVELSSGISTRGVLLNREGWSIDFVGTVDDGLRCHFQ